ncbi:MAG TPA: hypothetical protein VH165_02005 [Kofleriaceae bacterium]|nr:hypothetical protein [Kofleriaceae bacterium]
MRAYAALFAIGLAVYGVLAWDRVWHPSPAPHFVYQADAWLHGQAAIEPPLTGDDWAKVETVALDDGSTAQGRRLSTRPAFRTLDGRELPAARIRGSLGKTAYMSFPPFPTVLMLPGAAIAGRAGNDVIPTLLVAALILPLALLVLRRLAASGLSRRSPADELWLVATLAFGSVLWFAAVQGEVWYTAHVVGVALALGYAWASIEARHPVIAGLALGAAALTRTAMAFMVVLFLGEAWRIHGGLAAWRTDRGAVLRALRRPVLQFAAPVAGFALAGLAYNYVRFGAPTEFGHTYLDVRQQAQIEQFGLASYHYLARNLAVAFTLLPELSPRAPYVQISGHGLALWFTTPVLVLLIWPRDRNPLHRTLWLCVAAVALPSLLYQNSGWVQFGYRFSLDYLVLLIMLLAIGGRPLTWVAKTLIVAGIAINLFGALTFDRSWKYYRVGGNAYDVVVAH